MGSEREAAARPAAPADRDALAAVAAPATTKVNPFEYNAPVTPYERFKVVLLAPLVIVRVVLFTLLLTVVFLAALLASAGVGRHGGVYAQPLSPWRRSVLSIISPCCRAALFVFGFYRIKVSGKLDPRAALLVPNHVSMFDLLAMYWLALPSGLSKAETFKLPIIGTIFRALQVIPVQRESEESKREATERIMRFAKSRAEGAPRGPRFPPILVFPQGTTCREEVLTMFQRGAFLPGQPVQPVALKYPWKHFNPAFVVAGKGDWFLLRHLTQFVLHLEVTFLPTHVPSEAERRDPTLFANNVRAELAEELGASTTNHSFEDAKLYRFALNLAERTGLESSPRKRTSLASRPLRGLELRAIKDLFTVSSDGHAHFTLNDAKQALEHFASLDTDHDGYLSLEEFAAATGYDPQSPHTERLFDFFDRDASGRIDFRELVIGQAVASPFSSSAEDRVRLAFDIFDQNGDGQVSESELRALVRFAGQSDTSRHARATQHQLEVLLDAARAKVDRHDAVGGEQSASSPRGARELRISWDSFRALVPRDSALVSTAFLALHPEPGASGPGTGRGSDAGAASPGQDQLRRARGNLFPGLVRLPSSQLEEPPLAPGAAAQPPPS